MKQCGQSIPDRGDMVCKGMMLSCSVKWSIQESAGSFFWNVKNKGMIAEVRLKVVLYVKKF